MRFRYLILLITTLSYADCRVEDVLFQIRPNSKWVLSNHDPNTLQWLDASPKPSAVEISSGTTVCNAALVTRQQLVNKALFDVKSSTVAITTKFSELLIILNLDH